MNNPFQIRRISTRLLLAVVAAVLVPFTAFAVFVDREMAQRLSKEVVLHSLKGLAVDLAERIDRDLAERNLDLQLWTAVESTRRALGEQELAGALGPGGLDAETVGRWRVEGLVSSGEKARFEQVEFFDACVDLKQVYDLVLLVGADGRLAACNSRWPSGEPLAPSVLTELYRRDYNGYEWFQLCMEGRATNVGRAQSDLVPFANEELETHPENYHLGFGGPVFNGDGEVLGVLFALMNWKHVQERVREPVLVDVFQGLVGPEVQPSAYAWVWDSDADTIIAHPKIELYGSRVSGPEVGLPQLVEAARSAEGGFYPEYTFLGERKNAAFKHTHGTDRGGFDWIVGVGIDNADIYRATDELRSVLWQATLLVMLVAVLWTMVIARRATSPILALKAHTQRVAAGDLDARILVTSDDELGELARDFNRMTAELKEGREQLVRVEKDAAWREMARQVAHDIKNPLTPIKLSVDLLRRAKRDGARDLDQIFDRTLDTIGRQVEHLREIASDFHALTGASKGTPSDFDLAELVGEVLELNRAWADELGVATAIDAPGRALGREDPSRLDADGGRACVHVDRGLLRRVLINVVSNALQAMPDGGRLDIAIRLNGERVLLELLDTGHGLSEEAREHLFEPYFTTKSHGTGLGLAIARRVVEEMGGAIGLRPRHIDDPSRGTVCRIVLPRAPRPSERPAQASAQRAE